MFKKSVSTRRKENNVSCERRCSLFHGQLTAPNGTHCTIMDIMKKKKLAEQRDKKLIKYRIEIEGN